jgi:hypothetical protein
MTKKMLDPRRANGEKDSNLKKDRINAIPSQAISR